MTNQSAAGNHIVLGERAPWFSAQLIPGGSFDLQASAGRWVVLSFFGSPANPRANAEFAKLLSQADLFKEDHLIVGCVFTEPPEDIAKLAEISSSALFFLADYDGAISRSYGALEMPRTIVLDPMLRAVADIAWDFPQGHAEAVGGVLRNLPAVDDSAGVPMSAPALILPRVFSFELCDFLIQFYEQQGGEDSGFQFDIAGKTTTLSDWRLKRRSDVILAVPEIRDLIRNQIVRRLLPEIERYFQFQVTRMDRYIVACYDSEVGGHFHRHRDNLNAGAQHRRFAVSINLNSDFDGCDLMFPEFGRKVYRPPDGGALVFSCGALHQVTKITRGKRYAFLAFLYGEEDAQKREANNSRLHIGERQYLGDQDRLFPEDAELHQMTHVA
ncbi:2OG-Fe(II) oxygenase [Bradyrhizobium canariense]|uniref:Peroxiredoxin n=2 Tax=Bradyrhizobium canariense TaxID=255045 RepID=A0A1H1LYT2_9BRAD|nr:2OG-Fe(II) oxygenase [Bradyrhizobium canariense]SDR79764.1 Peroxiredoxin [Bradyrhizobium canariense]